MLYKNMEQTKRNELYKKLSTQLQDLYASPESGALLRQVFTTYQLNNSLYTKYVRCVGDTILGFYKTTDIPELLQKEVGVSADDAQRIFSDLQSFLAPVIEREKNEENPNRPELKELEEVFQKQPAQTTAPDVTEDTIPESEQTPTPNTTAPTQQDSTQIQKKPPVGIHTMETDINRIHGYGAYRAKFPDEVAESAHKEEVIRSASQEELLQKKPTLADMPTYEEGEENETKV